MNAHTDVDIFAQIDQWYEQAPAGMSLEAVIDWVQDNSEIPCPDCAEWLWVVRGENAGNRGSYYLALCQNDHCHFQLAG